MLTDAMNIKRYLLIEYYIRMTISSYEYVYVFIFMLFAGLQNYNYRLC